MWQPDGWGFRARLGLLVPHAAIGSESELAAMAPAGVSIHATRVPLGVMRAGGLMDPTIALEPVRAFADPPLVDEAAELLAAAPLHAIGFAFTSSSYVRGAADDEVLRATPGGTHPWHPGRHLLRLGGAGVARARRPPGRARRSALVLA